MKKIIKVKCIVCQKEFEKREEPIYRHSDLNTRQQNALTCSKGCSKLYNRKTSYHSDKKKYDLGYRSAF